MCGGDEEKWRPIGREDGEDWQIIRDFLGKANGWGTRSKESGVGPLGLGFCSWEERAVAGKFT